jgi:hypothetical protein
MRSKKNLNIAKENEKNENIEKKFENLKTMMI